MLPQRTIAALGRPDALVATGEHYAAFALDRPAHFDAMWDIRLLDPDDVELTRERAVAFDVLYQALRTAPASTTTPSYSPRRPPHGRSPMASPATSASTQVTAGPSRLAVSSMDGLASTPTTSIPARRSSIPARPVPQPASRTDEGARERTNVASPWTSTPVAPSASKRRW